MPGAAEMYMGFMKNGFSLMLLFLLSFVLFVAGSGFDFLIPFCAVLWFYGFFHARNLAGMDDQDFLAMKDRYVWEEFSDIKFNKLAEKSSKKWIAIALIVVGAAMLWDVQLQLAETESRQTCITVPASGSAVRRSAVRWAAI